MMYEIRQDNMIKRGFSLIEIMIGLAIIALIAATVGPAAIRFFGQAKVRTTESSIQSLKQSINSYYLFTSKYPATLEDLVRKPEGMSAAKWGGPYLGRAGEEIEEVPKDGFGDEFVYELTGDKNKPYRLYSVNLEEKEE